MSDGFRRDDKAVGERLRRAGDSTRAVHSGERDHQNTDAITTPIYQTSTFWFENSASLRELQEGRDERDEYGRYGNPTWRAVERKLCDLEGAEEAVLFASGMCAVTTLFFALLSRGGHLVITSDCYRRTRQFIENYLVKLDVETTVIEPASTDELANALRDDTSIFFTESPTNPYLRVIDLPKAVEIAHARGAKVVIDSTFATPLCHRPLAWGADYAIHSATKYLGGHNDLLAGVVLGSAEAIKPVREAAGMLGGILDAHSAYLLLRGLKTLALRMDKHNSNAMQVARWLEGKAAVRRVWYPGLESHPDHATASEFMRGCGGVVTFDVKADFNGTCRFVDACQIPYIAASLGGVESLIEMPALISYWDLKPEERLELGIADSLVRLSCGVEDAADLISDLEQALESI
jgi:cystathionine gamma-synthase